MKTATKLTVSAYRFSFVIYLSRDLLVVFDTISKIIWIDKIATGVIWRINKNHLDLPVVVLLQQLEYLQVIALNVEVLWVSSQLLLSALQGRRVPVVGVCASRSALIFLVFSPCSCSYRLDILANRASSILPDTLSS